MCSRLRNSWHLGCILESCQVDKIWSWGTRGLDEDPPADLLRDMVAMGEALGQPASSRPVGTSLFLTTMEGWLSRLLLLFWPFFFFFFAKGQVKQWNHRVHVQETLWADILKNIAFTERGFPWFNWRRQNVLLRTGLPRHGLPHKWKRRLAIYWLKDLLGRADYTGVWPGGWGLAHKR